MPELEYSTTNPIPPETLLAQSIAELVIATRATVANLRTLRRVFLPKPTWERGQCPYETHPESVDSYPCSSVATVYNFADDTEYCLKHHRMAERQR
jgi:hypothetical protein